MIWTFDAFELDDRAYMLRRAGEMVPLRRKVFEVLHYLVVHGGSLVTKEELLANVWPNARIIEAVIPQNIAALRQALGDTRGTGKIIQTVHGKGYRFVAPVRKAEQSLQPTAARSSCVGREHPLAELRAQLQQVLAGHGQAALIHGEPGIGKSRLAHELVQHARTLNVRIASAHCQDIAGALPYRPWIDALRGLIDAEDRQGQVARLLRAPWLQSIAPEPMHADQGALTEAGFRLFDAVASLLARVSRERPLLLCFDDLQWADHASLQLFTFLARELRDSPLLLLGTTRPLDRIAPATAPLMAALLSQSHVQRVPLAGLSATATAELIAQHLGRAPGPEMLREVFAVTEGSPLFVLELVRLLHDGGELTEDPLPRGLREVILRRVRQLGPDAERVLGLAAVIGQDFRLPVLEVIAEISRPALLDVLTLATQARVLQDLSRFSHALMKETLYEALPIAQRARLHARVGRALEAVLGPDVDAHLSELALHFQRAAVSGESARAVTYCRRAAEQAFQRLGFEQAVAHYRDALDALVLQLPIDETLRFELKLGLGSALFRAGEDATPVFEEAAAVARSLRRSDLLARVVLALQGWPRLRRRGRTDNPAFYPLLCEALAARDLAADQRARLASAAALNAPEGTPLPEQIARSRDALELARGTQDLDVQHDALVARLRLMGDPHDTEARLALAQELLSLAERSGEPERIFHAHELCIQPWLALGQLEQADRAARACARVAQELQLPRFTLQVLRFRLQRALGDGHFDEVRRLTKEAVAVRGRAPASPNYLVSLYVWQSFERAWRGDEAWVARHIAALLPKVEQAPLLRAHLAALCALFGRSAEAQRCYRPLLALHERRGRSDDDWFVGVIWTAEAVVACRDREAAAALYAQLLPYAAVNVTHLEWLVYLGSCAHWLGGLAGLLGDLRAAAEHFEAALSFNSRLGARPALAMTCFEYARVLLESRDAARLDRACQLLEQAALLAAALDMGRLQAAIAALEPATAR